MSTNDKDSFFTWEAFDEGGTKSWYTIGMVAEWDDEEDFGVLPLFSRTRESVLMFRPIAEWHADLSGERVRLARYKLADHDDLL